MATEIPRDQVQPGDWADHKMESFDPRKVTRVDHEKGMVWLDILGLEYGPFDLDGYTYTRS